MTKLVRFSLLAALLVNAIGQWGCNRIQGDSNSIPTPSLPVKLEVKALPVSRQDWIVTVPIFGNLSSLSVVEIKAEVGGPLFATYFQEGDLVRKGRLLAEIDTTNYRLAFDQAVAALSVTKAGLERAKIMADHARRERERAENLLRSGGITDKDYQSAITGVKEAESQVLLAEAQCEQAQAAVAIAEKSLKDCKIMAPIQGRVQRKFYDEGTLLIPGSSIYTIVDNSKLELDCMIPSYRLSEIRIGQNARFTTPTYGERRFEASVAAISPMIEADSRSVKVKLKVANPRDELRSGMYARGEITIRHESAALVIFRDSLIAEEQEPTVGSVFVVQDGKAHLRTVQIVDSQENRLRIQGGLEEGEMVILEIGPELKDGIPVRVMSNLSETIS